MSLSYIPFTLWAKELRNDGPESVSYRLRHVIEAFGGFEMGLVRTPLLLSPGNERAMVDLYAADILFEIEK